MADVWYVTNDKNQGFTSDPEQAIKDLTGAPVLAPGVLIRFQKQLVAKARLKIKEAKAKAWDEGYDAGESWVNWAEYAGPGEQEPTIKSGNPYKENENNEQDHN